MNRTSTASVTAAAADITDDTSALQLVHWKPDRSSAYSGICSAVVDSVAISRST